MFSIYSFYNYILIRESDVTCFWLLINQSQTGWDEMQDRNYSGVASITQVTHVRNKNSNIQGKSLNVIKVLFHTTRNCS